MIREENLKIIEKTDSYDQRQSPAYVSQNQEGLVDGDDQDIFLFMLAEALIHLKVSTISKIRQGSDSTRVRCKMNQEIKA